MFRAIEPGDCLGLLFATIVYPVFCELSISSGSGWGAIIGSCYTNRHGLDDFLQFVDSRLSLSCVLVERSRQMNENRLADMPMRVVHAISNYALCFAPIMISCDQ